MNWWGLVGAGAYLAGAPLGDVWEPSNGVHLTYPPPLDGLTPSNRVRGSSRSPLVGLPTPTNRTNQGSISVSWSTLVGPPDYLTLGKTVDNLLYMELD